MTELHRTVRKNKLIFGATIALAYGAAVMMIGLAPLTVVALSGKPELSGLPAAIFLIAAAGAAYPAGRAMDRVGRIPVVAWGFVAGVSGTLLVALACELGGDPGLFLSVVGFALTGGSSGVVMLGRLAGADMSDSEHKGRGVAQVLFGAVFGGVFGPFVFMPTLPNAGEATADMMSLPWLTGAAVMGLGWLVVRLAKTDPLDIARQFGNGNPTSIDAGLASVSSALRDKNNQALLYCGVTIHALMVALMSLISFVMSEHGHAHGPILVVVGIHFVGMFGPVLLAGRFVDTAGYWQGILLGLLLTGVSVGTLGFTHTTAEFALNMFILGIGWNLGFISVTSALSNRVGIEVRGKLLGVNDLLASLAGAGLSLLGGVGFSLFGLPALWVGGLLLLTVPAYLAVRGIMGEQLGAKATTQ